MTGFPSKYSVKQTRGKNSRQKSPPLTMKIQGKSSVEIYGDEMDLREIIRKENLDAQEEALYVCDLSDIVNKYYIWRECLPRVVPFYAVKCNDNPFVLKLLAALGTGFDCASKGEIKKILSMGVDAEKIIFANPAKPNSHVLYAAAKGIATMTFDSDFELYKIAKTFPDANLVIRIRCDAEKAQCPLGQKFGCDAELEAPGLISLAKELGLKVIGVSFHVGSGCEDFPVYERAICAAKTLFKYAKTLGYDFNLLDLGGGFPGDKGTSLKEVADIINKALDKYMPDSAIHIIAEPGRFFVSSAFTLICKIYSKREIVQNDKLEKTMYFINDGVYGSFNCILYDHRLAAPTYITRADNTLYNSSIWGPTCDALDQICETVKLPKLNIGDYLIFENMGAYTLPIASPFNGFPLPRVKFFMRASDETANNIF